LTNYYERRNAMERDKIILMILGMVYKQILRAVLVKAVSATDNELDNRLVMMLDALLNYVP